MMLPSISAGGMYIGINDNIKIDIKPNTAIAMIQLVAIDVLVCILFV